MRELLAHIKYEGFDVYTYATPEMESYISVFGDNESNREIQDKINQGYLDCFIAEVEAYKHGILLGSASIGMNVYENPQDFVKELHGYNEDLVIEAVKEAKENIKLLCNELS